jgi:hypothetical protein
MSTAQGRLGASAGQNAHRHGSPMTKTDEDEWVVWNGSLGILDTAILDLVETGGSGRRACLAPPYHVVGPFNLDELEAVGRIAYGECIVMSRQRWREDNVKLRRAAQEQRRTLLRRRQIDGADADHRKALQLPLEGALDAAEIKAAFRRVAKMAHPDAGGNGESYRRITEARDALLERGLRAN